jgi:hypothetical protein
MDHYDFPRECVAVALNYIDRMILSCPCCSYQDYQLLSVACVFLAMKMSGSAKVLSVGCIAHHIQQRFSKEQIVDMEFQVLSKLEWLVHPPTALDFLYQYWGSLVVQSSSISAKDHQDILDTATFFIEHSFVDSFFSVQAPSSIAMAALSLTVQVQLPSFLDYETVQLCRSRLHELVYYNTAATEHHRTRSPVSVADTPPSSPVFGSLSGKALSPPPSFSDKVTDASSLI